MALLVGPIREDFNITDFQFSLLHGLAFTLFYIFLGLPVGWLADRFSRKWIISSGILFWSVMTSLCGFAKNFSTLFLARVGVGVGEATLSPATYSMLSDLYSPAKLRWATAVFAMGITLGSGTSYMIGGWLYDQLANTDLTNLPVFGDLLSGFSPWQLTFIIVGLPGVLVVLMLLFVKEPVRTSSSNVVHNDPMPLSEVKSFLLDNWQVYTAMIMSVSMMAIVGYGTLIWYPEFLVRTYSMSKTEAGSLLGLIFIIAGTGGTFAGAWFAGVLQKMGYQDANFRVVMIAATFLIIPGVVAPLLDNSDLVIALTAVIIFVHYTHFGVAMAGLQLVTPARMRAQVSAILLFMANLFGLALGGSFVAFFTDFVFGDDLSLRYSLASVCAVFYPIAAILVAWGLKYYRQTLAKV